MTHQMVSFMDYMIIMLQGFFHNISVVCKYLIGYVMVRYIVVIRRLVSWLHHRRGLLLRDLMLLRQHHLVHTDMGKRHMIRLITLSKEMSHLHRFQDINPHRLHHLLFQRSMGKHHLYYEYHHHLYRHLFTFTVVMEYIEIDSHER